MPPIVKFHSVVVLLTVTLMFLGLTTSVVLQGLTGSTPAIGAVVAALGSIGLYRLLVAVSGAVLGRWNWLLKKTLGPYYLRGTWGGFVLTKTGKPRLIVEKYEQTISLLTIRGWSFLPNGELEANWTTESTQVSAEKGELFCFYSVNVPYKDKVVEALGRLQFDRTSEREGPTRLTGYTVDTDATTKLRYDELRKLTDALLDLDTAKRETFGAFLEKLGLDDSEGLHPESAELPVESENSDASSVVGSKVEENENVDAEESVVQ